MPLTCRFLAALLVLELIPTPKTRSGEARNPVCKLGAQCCHQRVPFLGGERWPRGLCRPVGSLPPARARLRLEPARQSFVNYFNFPAIVLSPFFPSPFQSSKKPKTAEADTSSELAKKSKEVFRKEVSFPRAPGGPRATRWHCHGAARADLGHPNTKTPTVAPGLMPWAGERAEGWR